MKLRTHPENKCSNCQSPLDAATALGDDEYTLPKEGDVSVCGYCGQVSAFTEDLRIRKLSEEELHTLLTQNPDVAKTILEIQSVYAFLSRNS